MTDKGKEVADDSNSKMRAIPFYKACEPSALKIAEWPKPLPKDDEVLIQVKAFGQNYADIVGRKGLYKDAPAFPFVCGYEVSGVITAIGNGCASEGCKLKVGDKVLAMTRFGGYAEYAVTNHKAVVHLPAGMSMEEGASIPVIFLTAYYCLHGTGMVRKGMKVLIHSAAGGVGQALVQLCKLSGLEIWGTASSQSKLDLLTSLGVDHPVNYATSNFEEVIKDQCPSGLDIVFDAVGGSFFKKDMSLLHPGGRVVGYGVSSHTGGFVNGLMFIPQALSMLTFNTIDMILNTKAFVGVNMLRLADHQKDLIEEMLQAIVKLFEGGQLKTIISKTYSWSEIGQAHLDMQSRASTGKLVMTID